MTLLMLSQVATLPWHSVGYSGVLRSAALNEIDDLAAFRAVQYLPLLPFLGLPYYTYTCVQELGAIA
jgi:hypothetical protein